MGQLENNGAKRWASGSLQRVVRRVCPTGEAREWRLVAKEDIEGQEWTFPKGKRLRGFKDYRDGDWCVYEPGDYYNSRIFGVPESLLTVVRPAKRANDQALRAPRL